MDRYQQKLSAYENVSTGYSLLAADTATKHPILGKTGFTVYIQRIEQSVTTDAAVNQTYQDTAGTPVVVAESKTSPGLGPILWDFGPEGYPLTVDKGLDHVISAAGMAAAIVIQAYRKRTANFNANSTGPAPAVPTP
jgi:hypothetical protein